MEKEGSAVQTAGLPFFRSVKVLIFVLALILTADANGGFKNGARRAPFLIGGLGAAPPTSWEVRAPPPACLFVEPLETAICLFNHPQLPRFQHGVHRVVNTQLFIRQRRMRFDGGDRKPRLGGNIRLPVTL